MKSNIALRVFRRFNYSVLRKIAGKMEYQILFEELYSSALQGMNIGSGTNTDSSGEAETLNYIKQRLDGQDNLIVFDVGANVGNYSLMLKDILGENAMIFSFEPSKKTFERLHSNLNNTSNIKLFNFGFGAQDSKLNLYSDADESGLASIYHRRLDHFGIEMNKTEEIDIKTIDGFCEENRLGHIHFLKLDVEGHEINVLKGASKTLSSGMVDYIQFEFGGSNIDSRTYFQDFYYLLKDNYKIYRIVKDGLRKIEGYKEMHESFITTNYLSERKNL